MKTRLEIEEYLRNALHFEQEFALAFHELKLKLAVHKRAWYEHAVRAAYRDYFMTKARRSGLEWVLNLKQPEESWAYLIGTDEPPLPPGWPTKPDERFSQAAARESYKPWRQLVFVYNNGVERAGCLALTRKAFYECCLQDLDFQVRWTPYADLNSTPFGPISELDLDETAGPPIS